MSDSKAETGLRFDNAIAQHHAEKRVSDEIEQLAVRLFELHSEAITGHVWDWTVTDDEVRNKFRIRALNNALSTKEAECGELRAVAMRYAIVRTERLAFGGGFQPTGYLCQICKGRGDEVETVEHGLSCNLRAPKG